MKLHERLGCFDPAQRLPSFLASLQLPEAGPDKAHLISGDKWRIPLDCSMVAMCYYLMDDHRNARAYAARVVDKSKDFFFGTWRMTVATGIGTYDPIWWKRHKMWIDVFQRSIFWASCLNDWSAVSDLAAYPTDECPVGAGSKQEDRDIYVSIAMLLRGEGAVSARCMDRVLEGTRKVPRLLAAMLKALHQSDADVFNKALDAYLKHFKKQEFNKDISKVLCVDGTFFVNLGRHEGLEVVVPEPYVDHIVKLDG